MDPGPFFARFVSQMPNNNKTVSYGVNQRITSNFIERYSPLVFLLPIFAYAGCSGDHQRTDREEGAQTATATPFPVPAPEPQSPPTPSSTPVAVADSDIYRILVSNAVLQGQRYAAEASISLLRPDGLFTDGNIYFPSSDNSDFAEEANQTRFFWNIPSHITEYSLYAMYATAGKLKKQPLAVRIGDEEWFSRSCCVLNRTIENMKSFEAVSAECTTMPNCINYALESVHFQIDKVPLQEKYSVIVRNTSAMSATLTTGEGAVVDVPSNGSEVVIYREVTVSQLLSGRDGMLKISGNVGSCTLSNPIYFTPEEIVLRHSVSTPPCGLEVKIR